jgi:tetratricopeptide (TPR) repeat protein
MINNKKYILSALAAALVTSSVAVAQGYSSGNSYSYEFRDAVRLKEKGMSGRSSSVFGELARKTGKADPMSMSVLEDVVMQVPGHMTRMEGFVAAYPHSPYIPQMYFACASNFFHADDYEQALAFLNMVKQKQLSKSQMDEYLFMKAYCLLEKGDYDNALKGFLDVHKRPESDYTGPARYAVGSIYYRDGDFNNAQDWFEKSSLDGRFKDVSEYFILECRFMLKDYKYVTANAERMYDLVPQDRKPHLARIISESSLVLGDADNARKYYELGVGEGNEPDSRTDWFYSGSVLYAVDDYEGAIRSFSNMAERTDSIGQVANYHLGYSYIQTRNKVAALTAFRDAALTDYDPRITEDAYFNWAKLAFDINTDTSVFNDYLKKYPAKEQEDRINGYIAVAALHDRDYERAVEAYDRIDELDDDMVLNYMKANYLRAVQLVETGSYRLAIPCLKAAAYYSDRGSRFYQLSRYWLAESYYRNDQYDEALDVFIDLYNTSALFGRIEADLMPYNIAYCHFKKDNYTAALKWFDIYLRDSGHKYRKEALERRADCFFIQKKYKEACEAYDLVLDKYFSVNDIYPYYQAAVSYGLSKNHKKKIELLSHVMEASPSSRFYPEALFELGRAYVTKEDDDKAFECFNMLAAQVKDSTFVARAYIEMGSLARNQSQYNEALGYYKTVVEEMPLSGYVDDALAAIESIYQTRNEPEEYIAYIEAVGRGEIKSDDERENMIFNSAEQIYLSENYQKALVALQSYLDKYPDSANAYRADFYMAESYRMLDKFEQACDSYTKVIEKGEGSFVELSMLNFSNLSYRMERWEDAFGGYSSLYDSALLENNKYAAVLGMMRSAYRAHNYTEAVRNADRTIGDARADASLKAEALYIKAKSYLSTSRRDDAYAIFKELAEDVTTEYGAESAYLLILDSYDKGQFADVETKVYAFSDAGSGQVYWLAKSFIVLGDSFVERDELEQAKATFESVRDGYMPASSDDDVLDNVNMRLRKLEELMN